MGKMPKSRIVDVDGCPIHYLIWGSPDAGSDGLLFIHGGGAHAHWWSFIAPFFAENRPVAAIDLSGMGDSGHRTGDYGSPVHIPEIAAVIDDAPSVHIRLSSVTVSAATRWRVTRQKPAPICRAW